MWQDEVTVCQKAGHGAVTAEAALCARVPGIIKHSLPYQSIINKHSGCFLSGICPSGHQLRRMDRFFFPGCRNNYFSCLSPSFSSLWLLLVKTMSPLFFFFFFLSFLLFCCVAAGTICGGEGEAQQYPSIWSGHQQQAISAHQVLSLSSASVSAYTSSCSSVTHRSTNTHTHAW